MFDDAGIPHLREGEVINYQLQNIELGFGVANVIGKFNLYVTSLRVFLVGDELSFDIDVAFIVLHAISRDPASYPKPCLYCQLDQEDNEMPDELFLGWSLLSINILIFTFVIVSFFLNICSS